MAPLADSLFDASTTARLLGKPQAEILAVPIEKLRIPADTRRTLRDAHGVRTVGDLRTLDLQLLKLRPDLILALHCVLFYPKHDPGPDCSWEMLFESAPLLTYINWSGSPFHTRFGPVFYRGRLDGTAKVLVVGQDPSSDETLAGRIFVGNAGQLAQGFLAKIGITRSYVMFNTFLFGVQSSAINPAMVADPTLTGYRNQLLDKAKATSPITLVLAFGTKAKDAVAAWPGVAGLTHINLTHPTAPSGVVTNWNSHLAAAAAAVTPDAPANTTPYTGATPTPTDIPRFDLPFGMPSWHGTSGVTRSKRASAAFETEIDWTAP